MQRWELKRIWILQAAELHPDGSTQHPYYQSVWNDEAPGAWAQAESLADEGWELVACTSETRLHVFAAEAGFEALGIGSSYIVGHLLVFKRLKPQPFRAGGQTSDVGRLEIPRRRRIRRWISWEGYWATQRPQ